MIIYIVFLIAILVVNVFILCKRIMYLLKNSDYIKDDDDGEHIGEYSFIGEGMLDADNKTET